MGAKASDTLPRELLQFIDTAGFGPPAPILKLVDELVSVEKRAAPQDTVDGENRRTVRILRGFAFRVMLTVNGDPFLGHSALKWATPAEYARRMRKASQVHASTAPEISRTDRD